MKTEIFLCCFHFVTFHQGKTQQMPPIIRDIEREEVNGFGFSQQAKKAAGYSSAVLAPPQNRERNGKGTGSRTLRMIISKVNPLYETVCYQIGGTIFEIETSRGGPSLFYDKMTRFIKLETVKILGDKESQVRYNNDSTLFAGLSSLSMRTIYRAQPAMGIEVIHRV